MIQRSVTFATIALALFPATHAPLPQDAALPRGVVIPSVACAAKPEQSYALYLPSHYTSARRWPVIFAFDPGARGRVPVELLREAAEKYGYVLVGSNNSRNGPIESSIEAADAMMIDASRRFSLDARRIYTTGFSGGARVATLVALLCKDCVAGVFAHGAGFPPTREPPGKPSFVFFAAIGDLDFNYYELLELQQKLDALGATLRVRRYEGPHRWAPPEMCMEAIEWFELMAMKQGRREKDAAFIAEQFDRASRKVRELEQAGDLYALWLEIHKFATEFDGLADVSAFARRAAELKDSAAVREGARRERVAVEEQRRIVAPIADSLNALSSDPMSRSQIRLQLSSQISALLEQLKKNRDAAKGITLRRAQTELFAVASETGQQKLRDNDVSLAIACFESAAEILSDSPRPFLLIARAQAQSGKKKETLRALQQALARGFSADSLAAFLRDNAEFASFRYLPEFRQMLGTIPDKQ